jgi:hypothetical protein
MRTIHDRIERRRLRMELEQARKAALATTCLLCNRRPQAGVTDDHGRLLPYCDDCYSNAGDAQSQRKLEA